MKRCPDCGFRANDTICPLCGVRMRPLPDAARQLNTHSHGETGERCILPEEPPRLQRPDYRPAPPKSRQTRKKKGNSPSRLYPILAIILFVLLRSCMG